MLKVVRYDSYSSFLIASESKLLENEAENSLILGLCQSNRHLINLEDGILLLCILEGERSLAAAVCFPPYNLIISRASPEELDLFVDYLISSKLEVPGVVGPSESSSYFAQKYSSELSIENELGMDQKIFQCNRVIKPSVSGQLLKASEADLELISEYLYLFSKEALPTREKYSRPDSRSFAKKAIESGTAYIWVNEKGEKVSAAHVGRPTNNGISIRAVYTPPEFRRKGYGAAVVSSVTKRMINSGYKFTTLYTDASNLTSNNVFRSVGYFEVSKSKHFSFVRRIEHKRAVK